MPTSGKKDKSANETLARQKPPSWYFRLVILGTKTEDNDYICCSRSYPESVDFDEEISELNERELAVDNGSAIESCRCDVEGYECTCGCEIDDTDEEESERSYTGSDSHYYYELEERRTRRKFELLERKYHVQREKKKRRDLEMEKENEVQEAYLKLKETSRQGHDPEKLDLITNKMFRLYCTDFVDHYYDTDFFPPKYISFYGPNEGQPIDNEALPSRVPEEANGDTPTDMYDHVYLNVVSGCHFHQFIPPETCGCKKHKLEIVEGDTKVTVRFISRDYLTVNLPCALVSSPTVEIDPGTKIPKKFKFVGIRHDLSELLAWRRELSGKRKRSVSP
ncbi:hypothetical protein FGRMN_5114 [Fusarium graminum]|nr:hypothetical protein FGRMN_5114 [Fusarium graminum]